MSKKEDMLYGLVLAGGNSRRMKTDKSLLEYHGIPHVLYCFELLSNFCERVFISNRQHQSNFRGHKNLPQIHDRDEFINIGPWGGILSAMTEYPEIAWFVLACDLPYVHFETLQRLIDKRNPQVIATAYRSTHDGLPEPLCAIYEPIAKTQISSFLSNKGIKSPRRIMNYSDIELLELDDKIALDNINNLEEYNFALETLKYTKYGFKKDMPNKEK